MAITPKELEYAGKIMLAINETINNEDSDCYINLLDEETDITAFIYALGTIAPNLIYQKLTQDQVDNLEFNHIQNRLCFQFSKKD